MKKILAAPVIRSVSEKKIIEQIYVAVDSNNTNQCAAIRELIKQFNSNDATILRVFSKNWQVLTNVLGAHQGNLALLEGMPLIEIIMAKEKDSAVKLFPKKYLKEQVKGLLRKLINNKVEPGMSEAILDFISAFSGKENAYFKGTLVKDYVQTATLRAMVDLTTSEEIDVRETIGGYLEDYLEDLCEDVENNDKNCKYLRKLIIFAKQNKKIDDDTVETLKTTLNITLELSLKERMEDLSKSKESFETKNENAKALFENMKTSTDIWQSDDCLDVIKLALNNTFFMIAMVEDIKDIISRLTEIEDENKKNKFVEEIRETLKKVKEKSQDDIVKELTGMNGFNPDSWQAFKENLKRFFIPRIEEVIEKVESHT